MKMIKKLLLFSLFLSLSAQAQLANFNLQVIKTDETCLGNGSLTFQVSNTIPGGSILYKVFHLPETITPVAITTSNYVGSLVSGNYKVVAIQAVSNQSTASEATVVINDMIQPLDFSVSVSGQSCAMGGDLIINATSGAGTQYEIINGPITTSLQTSNVFELVPAGNYQIRVINLCGDALVKTFTLVLQGNSLNIGATYNSETASVDCGTIVVSHLVTPSVGTITYPVSAEFRLIPMTLTGEVISITQSYASGQPDSLVVSATVPRYLDQPYTYEVRITDNCNTLFERLDNIVDPSIGLNLETVVMPCSQAFFNVSPKMHTAPYTVDFIEVPEGFSAVGFNVLGNGPFYPDTISFGNDELAVPYGNYIVQVTDACGRIAQQVINIDPTPGQLNAVGENNGCFASVGRIRIDIGEQHIVSASIILAPAGFAYGLPHNVNSSISFTGKLVILNLPVGAYKVAFTDDCGLTHTVDVEVPPFTDKGFTIDTLPDCTAGYGTVKLRSGNGNLVTAILTSAPATFGQTLPYDVTAFIDGADGDLYMNHLPPGTYVFKAIDVCGTERLMTQQVYYAPHIDHVIFTPDCGSYSIDVADSAVGSSYVTYWLQKLDPASGTWGHPNGSSYGYVEGANPTTQNGMRITAPLHNIVYTGSFRVIKKFEAFNNGIAERSICFKILYEFTFNTTFSISNAYTLACAGSPNDIYIEAEGYGLTYRIDMKNGQPYSVNNGTSNVFTNLELSATYVFSVEDLCGNRLTKEVTLRELPSIAEATTPNDMVVCEEAVGDLNDYQFRLKDQDDAILGTLHSAVYTVTYHLTQEDADSGTNGLPEYYSSTHNGQVIYARLVHNEIGLCHGTTSFKLFASRKPELHITSTGTLCEGEGIYLTAPQGFTNYLWSTGQTTRSILVTQPGVYGLIVHHSIESRPCDGYAEIVVTESVAPQIINIVPEDWTYDQNMITINASGLDNLLYSVDGVNWQEDNVFTGLESGLYTIWVKDAGGCGMKSEEVVLLNYPKFFTPNGDGYHERWRIKFSIYEPNLLVTIYDRFGKVVGGFDANDEGWDGTFNGAALPSTDYWFVVKREDGRELKGHFAMLR